MHFFPPYGKSTRLNAKAAVLHKTRSKIVFSKRVNALLRRSRRILRVKTARDLVQGNRLIRARVFRKKQSVPVYGGRGFTLYARSPSGFSIVIVRYDVFIFLRFLLCSTPRERYGFGLKREIKTRVAPAKSGGFKPFTLALHFLSSFFFFFFLLSVYPLSCTATTAPVSSRSAQCGSTNGKKRARAPADHNELRKR